MSPDPPTTIEVVVLRSRPHSYLTACSFDHAVSLAESIGDDARDPVRVRVRDDVQWCQACGWCGRLVVVAPVGVCLLHRPCPCPPWHRSATRAAGEALRHLSTVYLDGEAVPDDWVAQLLAYLANEFDRWADVHDEGAELGDIVALWAGLTPDPGEDPF